MAGALIEKTGRLSVEMNVEWNRLCVRNAEYNRRTSTVVP